MLFNFCMICCYLHNRILRGFFERLKPFSRPKLDKDEISHKALNTSLIKWSKNIHISSLFTLKINPIRNCTNANVALLDFEKQEVLARGDKTAPSCFH